MSSKILLGHGSGGMMTHSLLDEIILRAFSNPVLDQRLDAGIIQGEGRLAVTTDSFVISPPVFPGGDIGKLAVYGTVNDLAMVGATPLYLTCGLILEEGLEISLLKQVIKSMAKAAESVGAQIITGDTKVVEKGKGDLIFINTTGIGVIPKARELAPSKIQVGDQVILSGTMGDHGIAVLGCRNGMGLELDIKSDCTSLHSLSQAMLEVEPDIRIMRDPTRGGVSTVLNEIAGETGIEIKIKEELVPILPEVRGVCELLGLDPFYVANEGKLLAIVPKDSAQQILRQMHILPEGKNASIIGEVVGKSNNPEVFIETWLGTTRLLEMLPGNQLPRIC